MTLHFLGKHLLFSFFLSDPTWESRLGGGGSIHKYLPLDEQTQLTIHWLGWNFPEIQLLCKLGSWSGGGML